jgi:nucleoside-diphosphate-sugar epimerase
MSNKKTICITGGCGFVGSNLIKDLIIQNDINEIVVIDNLSQGTFFDGIHDNCVVSFYKEDCRNRSEIFNIFKKHKIDYVFMFHGLVSIYSCDANPYECFSNNVMGSINVFDACIESGVKKVIFSETSAMYEDSKILPHVETDWNPDTIYATSKACLHLLAESYKKTKGLTYTGLRYFNIFGPLQDFSRSVPPAACGFGIRLLQGNKPIIFGDGNRRRDFIHVDDVNRFHMQCISDMRTDNQVYNLGTGKSISLHELVQMFCDILKIENPGFIQAPEINGESFEIFANIDKAKAIGWKPKIDFYTGHESLMEYFKELNTKGIVPKNYMEGIDFTKMSIKNNK